MIVRGLAAGVLAGVLATSANAAPYRTEVRDVREFALSVCLIRQKSSTELRGQGFALGSILMQRTGGAIVGWKALEKTVAGELARQPVLTIHGDGPVGSETPAPLAECLDVLEAPAVRAAMLRLTR